MFRAMAAGGHQSRVKSRDTFFCIFILVEKIIIIKNKIRLVTSSLHEKVTGEIVSKSALV